MPVLIDKEILDKITRSESNGSVKFVQLSETDIRESRFGVFYNSKSSNPMHHNGIKVVFFQKNLTFMTVIFCDTWLRHSSNSLTTLLRGIINKKIRVYPGIFQHPYFDFETYCGMDNGPIRPKRVGK